MAVEGGAAAEEVVTVELPAPPGWTKTFVLKSGGLPKENEVVFVAPTGEEIRSKKQLDQYLRSHPGGLRSSVFDWGAGDTPRRSARISERVRARVAPEIEPPVKKGKRSASRKGGKERRGGVAGDAQAQVVEGDTKPMEEDKEDVDIGMKSSEAPGEGDDVGDTRPMEKDKEHADIGMKGSEAPGEGADVGDARTMEEDKEDADIGMKGSEAPVEGADVTLDDAGQDAVQKAELDTLGKNAEAARDQGAVDAEERANEEDAQTKNAVQEEGKEEKSAGTVQNNAETTKAQAEGVEEKADEAAPVTSVLPGEELSTGKETAAENGGSSGGHEIQGGQEQVDGTSSQTSPPLPPTTSSSSNNDGQPRFPQASPEALTC